MPRPRKKPPAPTTDRPLVYLPFNDLRSYRQQLRTEEERVSYWRRVVQARLDLIEARPHADGALDLPAVARALGATGTGATRNAFLRIAPADPLPDLPDVHGPWVDAVDPADPDSADRVVAGLRTAEAALSQYRAAVLDRLNAATEELIVRYQQEPDLALRLIPDPSPLASELPATTPRLPMPSPPGPVAAQERA